MICVVPSFDTNHGRPLRRGRVADARNGGLKPQDSRGDRKNELLRSVAHVVICSPFDDPGCDHRARDEILACCDAGIAGGYDDGLYHAESPVTRAQTAVFICRAFDLPM